MVRNHRGFSHEPTPNPGPINRTTNGNRHIAAYSHPSQMDIDALGNELDAIRRDVEEPLGETDAAYI